MNKLKNKIGYYLSASLYYIFLVPLSFLPFTFIYWLSNGAAFALEYVFKYRKQVILQNLTKAFPLKSLKEIKVFRSQFYQHFTDVLFESLKNISISKATIEKKVHFKNIELTDKLYQEESDILFLLGHFGNWELICTALPLAVKYETIGIYKPLRNVFFDEKVKAIRARFGLKLVPVQETKKSITEKTQKPKAIILLTDQSPSQANSSFWTSFLNQETAILMGAEKFSRIYNMPVVFLNVKQVKRGYYEIQFELFEKADNTKEIGEITEWHTQKLEKEITENPALWLWSHKRWKLKRPKKEAEEK